jgi:TetR/AcrR family transcriptional repressor of nem operon
MTPTGRPREFDRTKVLETAMELFWEKGFEATSKRDLMDATGIASQSLYNAFGDKRELFDEAVRRYAAVRREMLAGILLAAASPLEGVRHFVHMWSEDCSAGDKGCMMANCLVEFGDRDDAMARFLHEQMQQMREVFVEALTRARTAGELDTSADIEAIASTLVCTTQGVALMRRSGAPADMLKQVVEGTLGLLE